MTTQRKRLRKLRRAPAAADAPKLFYIKGPGVCGNSVFWWRPDGCGYTCNLNEAWKVSLEKARSICSSRPGIDRAFPVEWVDSVAQRHVDCQLLPKGKASMQFDDEGDLVCETSA